MKDYNLMSEHPLSMPYIYKDNTFYDDIICLDFETTAMYNINDKWIPYDYTISEQCYRNCEKLSFVYIWMISINGDVFYGRKLRSLRDVLVKLNRYKCYIYVHNLSYEFQYLRNIAKVEKTFTRNPHHEMYVIFKDFPNIEFRCSYMLTRLSLENWGKKITVETGVHIEKKVGSLMYNVFRTPNTDLTEDELNYCKYDVLVMHKGLELYRSKYKHIKNIPLTQTGEIRREIKKASRKCFFNIKATELQPHYVEEFDRALAVLRGGDSHGNYIYANQILVDVDCYDYESSYPFNMCTQKIPMSKFEQSSFLRRKNMGYIIYVRYTNIQSLSTLHYIPRSKSRTRGEVHVDNGRIIGAEFLEIYITDLDYDIIEKNYSYEKVDIIQCYSAILGYMPRDIIEVILSKFAYKTQLKGVEGMEGIYMASKEFINGIYGLSITSLIHTDYIFDDDSGKYSTPIESYITRRNKLSEQVTHPSKNPLHYYFGLWTVTRARKMLWDGFDEFGHENIAYYDTDSYKGWLDSVVADKISLRNKNALEEMGNRYGFDENLLFPKRPDGKVGYMGHLEQEKGYNQFKFLGSKKYAYIQDGDLHITVAGLSKKAKDSFNTLDDFTPDFYVNPSKSRKMGITYTDSQPLPCIDGYQVEDRKAAILTPMGFSNTTDEFLILSSQV